MKLVISSTLLNELQQEALAAAPEECCGLLLGQNNSVSKYELTKNIASIPEKHFEIDPSALIAAERSMREGGLPIIGYFHSHPSGKVEPSRTDADNAATDGRIWLILNGKEAAAWQTIAGGKIFGRFHPIALESESSKRLTAHQH